MRRSKGEHSRIPSNLRRSDRVWRAAWRSSRENATRAPAFCPPQRDKREARRHDCCPPSLRSVVPGGRSGEIRRQRKPVRRRKESILEISGGQLSWVSSHLPNRNYWVQFRCSPGGNVTGDESHGQEEQRHGQKHGRIMRAHAVEQTCHHGGGRPGKRHTGRNSDTGEHNSLS